jgi:hypothetical protein
VKPVMCLDFDGVLKMPDGSPVPGAVEAVTRYLDHFDVLVYSARSARPGGIQEMKWWLRDNGFPVDRLGFPPGKVPLHVLIDDQAVRFEGSWPEPGELLAGKSWVEGR